ncbi:hypothetical protein ACFX16_025816 [Malus domestica]
MRVKRQKRHRKSVRFYTACYGFRQPYKVLCDVTFVHHLVTNRITPADKAISNVLGAPVLLFTTKCALAELKQHGPMFGPSYSQSLEAANSLIIARCDHESPASAEDCILDVVGQSNSEHFFVATQHVDLRQKLLKIPGVPAIYALRTALLLESPSDAQCQFVKSSEEQRLHMTELEYKMLKKKRNILNFHGKDDPSGEEDGSGDFSNSCILLQLNHHTVRDPRLTFTWFYMIQDHLLKWISNRCSLFSGISNWSIVTGFYI